MGKDKKRKRKDQKELKPELATKLNKFDIMTEIDKLSSEAQKYKMEGDIEKAIKTATKIVSLAMDAELKGPVEEQDRFLKEITSMVEKDHFMSKILEDGEKFAKLYDNLVEEGKFLVAHEMLENLRNSYAEVPFFEKIPLIANIILKDARNWVLYQNQGL